MKTSTKSRIIRFIGVFCVALMLLVTASNSVRAEDTEPQTAKESLLKSIVNTARRSEVYQTTNVASTTLPDVINRVTQTFIGLLGVISTLLIIYAGYLWMTAGGDDSKIEKAKSIIKQVIVGFIVLSLAYGIIAYVFYAITIAGSGQV